MYFPDSDPDKDPLKPEWGAWYIVINSLNTSLEKFGEPLRALWKYIVTHPVEFFWSKRVGAELLEVQNLGDSLERGEIYHRIHLNGYIAVKTTGLAYLDINKLIAFVNKNLDRVPGFKACNIKYKKVKNFNANKAITDYIKKDPLDEEGEEFEVIPP